MPIRMRELLILCGIILCLMFVCVSSSLASPCSSDNEAPGIYVPDRGCFGLGIGYQFQHFNVLGETFHNHDYNANFEMHLFDWVTGAAGRLTVSAEVDANAGFDGRTGGNPPLHVKSVFAGAGPHISIESRSRFEPWIHGVVGLQHFRFTQTATLGSNSALGFMVGGGVDIRLAPRVYWRVQGDYLGTNFQSSIESNYSMGTGIIFHF